MGRAAFSFVLVFLSMSASSAESLRLTVLDMSGTRKGPGDRLFDGRYEVVASPVGSTPAEERRVNITRGQATLRLPPGLWRIVARSDGYWGLPEEVRLSETAGAPTEVTLALRVWKGGTITGSLAAPDGPVPPTLRLDFQSSPGRSRAVVPHSVVDCPVRAAQWACEVPGDTLDVQLRAPGFIPHYRWGVNVSPGMAARLGALELRRGASLVGYVETDVGVPAVGVRAELVSPAGDPIPSQAGRSPESSFVAVTNERGFFQLAPLPPADHLIVARRTSFADAQAPVRILKDLEARLAQPLSLKPPLTLDVFVSPAQDPWGGPWTIELRSDPPSGRAQPIGRAQSVPENGHWQRKGVSAGAYAVMLSSSTGVRWADQPFNLGDNSEPLNISLSALGVEGTVKLGGEPLQAKVVFGGQNSAIRVPLAANERGEFEGLLPEVPGAVRTWDVYVESHDPRVSRVVEAVDLAVVPGTAKARVEIDLPATEIVGDVLDEAAQPFDGASLVSAQHVEGDDPTQIQIQPGDKGHFKLVGLRPGTYRVRALARSTTAQGAPLESDEVSVVAREGPRPSPVRLTLRENLVVSGRVVTMDGTGIPGVRVSVSAPQSPLLPSRVLVTDPEGRFKTPLPRGTVAVGFRAGAPGLGYYIGLVPVEQQGEVTVRLQRGGGTLSLEIPPTEDPNEFPFLIKDGFYAGVPFLMSVAGLGGGADAQGRIALSPLADGRYVLCMARIQDLGALMTTPDPSRCTSGSLSAPGVLSLRVPSRTGTENVKAGQGSR